MKLAVVGGGSTYTPELVSGFASLQDVLPLRELWLIDPDEERRRLVGGISQRMFARAGHPGAVHTTPDLVAGVRDADAVLLQFRVGGQDARHGDETWPHLAGVIGQETTGPGGFAKALRTVPVALQVAEAVRRHAKPDAWIIDFTNPVGVVTRALNEAGHRVIGLCNVAIGFQRRFADRFGVAPGSVRLDHVGLNHLTWELGVHVTRGGVESDMLPELLEHDRKVLAADMGVPAELLAVQGSIPSYYLRYYYAHDAALAEQLRGPSRAEQVLAVERSLLRQYADPAVDTKPPELALRGGAFYSEAAIDLLVSLSSGRADVQVLNVRNGSTLPFLPADHVVEVPCRVGAEGPVPLPVPQLADDVRGLISAVAGYERLALDAALRGGRDRVLRAMVAHPLVLDVDRAGRLTDLLIAANLEHLPWVS